MVGVDSQWSLENAAYVGDCGDQELTVDNLVMRRVGCENDTCGDGACAVGLDGPDRCGSCWMACFSGEVCRDGQCVCDPPATNCPTGCLDLTRDSMNCGECGRICQACFVGTCPTAAPDCANPFRISGPIDDLALTVPASWLDTWEGVVLEWTPAQSGTVAFDAWFEPPYSPPASNIAFFVPAATGCDSVLATLTDEQLADYTSTLIRPVEAGVPILMAIYGFDLDDRQLRHHLTGQYLTSP
jgi:hypothetical protein